MAAAGGLTYSGWQAEPPYRAGLDRLLADCVATDHVAPLSGHVLEAASHPSGSRYFLVLDGTELAAVAVLPVGDPAELAVAPTHRRQGLGGRLLATVLELRASVWAHGDLPAARALAAREGLRTTRELLQMRSPLRSNYQSTLPDGIRIRTFVPGQDEDAFLAVNRRAFAWHPEQGRLDRSGLAAEMRQSWFDPAGFFLAVDAGDRVLGYHWTKIHPTDDTPVAPGDAEGTPTGSRGPIGEIYVLGVDPESPVRRLGEPLSVAGLDYLRDRGLTTAMLYVEADNGPAVRLYERLGFTRYLADVVYQR